MTLMELVNVASGSEPVATDTDGPLPQGMVPECHDCHRVCDCDIYRYRGRTLCGECRYRARHGKSPPRTAKTAVSGRCEDVSPWQENAIRCMEDCR